MSDLPEPILRGSTTPSPEGLPGARPGFSRYGVFGEAGLSVYGHLLTSTVSRTEEGHVIRGLSNLTLNDRQRLTRWITGDSIASSGGLGGTLPIFGRIPPGQDVSIGTYNDTIIATINF